MRMSCKQMTAGKSWSWMNIRIGLGSSVSLTCLGCLIRCLMLLTCQVTTWNCSSGGVFSNRVLNSWYGLLISGNGRLDFLLRRGDAILDLIVCASLE